jgi:hypothetical protein
MTWQPIETAPKDGTEIDLWMVDQDGKGYREPAACWVTRRRDTRWNGKRYVGFYRDGWWGPNHDYDGEHGWADEPGYTNQVNGKQVWVRPTHWMPMPAPPGERTP